MNRRQKLARRPLRQRIVKVNDEYVNRANRSFDRKMRVLKATILRDVRKMIVNKNQDVEEMLHEEEDAEKSSEVNKNMYNGGMEEELKAITNMLGKLMKQFDISEDAAPGPAMDAPPAPPMDDEPPLDLGKTQATGGHELEVPDPEGDNDTKESVPPTAPGSPATKAERTIKDVIRDEVRKTMVGRPIGVTPNVPAADVAGGGPLVHTNETLFTKSWEEIEELARGRFTTLR